jgi:hypothetical protein
MKYILILIHGFGQAYQVTSNGCVTKYVSLDGGYIYDAIPSGVSSHVIDPNPPTPSWHVDVPDVQAEQPQPAPRTITKLEYMNRFHDDELAALYTAAKSAVQIEIWLEKFKLAEFIDLDDPRTVAGVQALEASHLIGVGRASEILA